jgi:hypothetical protein
VSSGGATPAISMAAATTSVNGYLTSTDWTTFNGKQAALVSGTNIKTVSGTTLLGSGDLGAIGATYGGTGQTVYAVGDLLYASTTTALSKLADVATGNAIISGGVGVAPSYGKIGLTTHVSGVLPVANGGTNASTASITSFNNITGYTASGATGTTNTNLVFSTSPSITTPTLVGDATLSTGNLVVSNGKGIDFSATPGTGTSELFADYEEGTWTPAGVLSSPGSSSTSNIVATYTKVGRLVTVACSFNFTLGTGSGNFSITGLPFAANSALVYTAFAQGCENIGALTKNIVGYINPSNTNFYLILQPQGTGASAQLTSGEMAATSTIRISATYAT